MGTELGEWSLEMKGNKLAVAGKKLYALMGEGKTKTACKGARLSATEIERVAKGEVITWQNPARTFSLEHGQRVLSRKIRKTA